MMAGCITAHGDGYPMCLLAAVQASKAKPCF